MTRAHIKGSNNEIYDYVSNEKMLKMEICMSKKIYKKYIKILRIIFYMVLTSST